MFFNLRESGVEARPFRRRFGPNGRRGRRQIGIVECACANECERRTLLGFAEDLGATLGAEAPMHGRAAIGSANVVAQRAGNGDILLPEERADCPGPAAKILAHPTPAITRSQRRFRLDLVPNRPAETSARDRQEKNPLTVQDHTYEKS